MTDRHGPNWNLFREICDEQTIAVTASDPDQDDTSMVYANKHFLELTGYDEADVLGRNCRFLQGPEAPAQDQTALRDPISYQKYSVNCLLNYRKDGESFLNMAVFDEVRIDRDKRLLLGSHYPLGEQVEALELQEQFDRTDAIFNQLALQTQKQMKDTLLMRSEALTALVRARMMMVWVEENVNERVDRSNGSRG